MKPISRKNKIGFLIGIFLWAANSQAESLSIDQVLQSVRRHYPSIQKQNELTEGAKGALQEAKGAFDTKIVSELDGYLTGYYDGISTKTYLQNTLPVVSNLNLFAGYRKSFGEFPVYEGQMQTLDSGEVFAGLRVDLLRQFALDENRLVQAIAEKRVDIEKAKTELEILVAQEIASKVYWEWVANGLTVDALLNLYNVAIERDKAIRTRVSKGDLAEIFWIENQQNILQRKTDLQLAQQFQAVAAQSLSLFYRDASGNPIVPDPSLAPKEVAFVTEFSFADQVDPLLEKRPEILRRDLEIRLTQDQIEHAKSLRAPNLSVDTQIKNDLGQGPETLDGTEWQLMANFEFPFQNRKARGKLKKFQAFQRSLEQERKLELDSLRARYKQLRERIENAVKVVENLAKELEFSEQLQKAEVKRWMKGDSDFFLINLREQNYARSQVALIRNKLSLQIALAEYNNLLRRFPTSN